MFRFLRQWFLILAGSREVSLLALSGKARKSSQSRPPRSISQGSKAYNRERQETVDGCDKKSLVASDAPLIIGIGSLNISIMDFDFPVTDVCERRRDVLLAQRRDESQSIATVVSAAVI